MLIHLYQQHKYGKTVALQDRADDRSLTWTAGDDHFNAVTTPYQCLSCWASRETALFLCFVFAGLRFLTEDARSVLGQRLPTLAQHWTSVLRLQWLHVVLFTPIYPCERLSQLRANVGQRRASVFCWPGVIARAYQYTSELCTPSRPISPIYLAA